MMEGETSVVDNESNPGCVDGSMSSESVESVSVTFVRRLSNSLCFEMDK